MALAVLPAMSEGLQSVPPDRQNTPLARLYLSQLWAVLEGVLAAGDSLAQDGRVAGAIGVAGAMTADEDRRIAEAAVNLACS